MSPTNRMLAAASTIRILSPMVSTPRPPVPPVVVPRWVQLVMLPIGILALFALARAAGTVLLIFVVAAVLALILNPMVAWLQRRLRFPRGIAVFSVYIGLLTAFAGGGFLLANPIADQAEKFGRDVPQIIDDANEQLARRPDLLRRQRHRRRAREPGGDGARDAAGQGGRRDRATSCPSAAICSRGWCETGLGLILVLVLSIYMLLYGQRIGAAVRAAMPPGDGSARGRLPDARGQRPSRATSAASCCSAWRWAPARAWACGSTASLGIFPEGRTYALAFGIFFGLMEMVPFVGPVLGAIPPILVAFFQDPLTGVWVGLLFLALQQIEGHIVAPQIFGHTLRINPILVIFALLVGGEIYGIIGALVALPIAAIARETIVYLRRHLVLESWNTVSPTDDVGISDEDPTPTIRA